MGNTVVVSDDDGPVETVAIADTTDSVGVIADEAVEEALERVEAVTDAIVSAAADEAIDDAVEEIVEDAAAIITEAQFAALHSRIDSLEHEMQTLRDAAAQPTEIIVVPPDDTMSDELGDVPIPPDDSDVADDSVDDDSDDIVPVVNEEDETPNRRLGWRAYVLGGSGGTRGRTRR